MDKNLNLQDFCDVKKLITVIQNWSKSTGFSVIVKGSRDEVLVESGQMPVFCRLVQETEAGCIGCKNNESLGTEICECHAGLTKFVLPLKLSGGAVVGIVYGGQVLNSEHSAKQLMERATKLGIEEAKLKHSLRGINRKSREEMKAAVDLLEAVLQSFIDNSYRSWKAEKERQEERQEADRDLRIMSSLSSDYNSIYYIDVFKDSYEIYRLEGELGNNNRELASSNSKLSTTFESFVELLVVDEQKEEIRKEIATENLIRRLQKEKDFTLRYRVKEDPLGREYFEMHFVNVSEHSEECRAVVGFRCMDAFVKAMLIKNQEIDQAKEALIQLQKDTEDTLYNSGTGLWTLDEEIGKAPRFEADRTMRMLLGVEDDITPEECFEHWFERIDKKDLAAVYDCMDRMIEDGFGEVTYRWNHPICGKIWIRCGGAPASHYEKQGRCFKGYHLNITETVQKDEQTKTALKDAYESVNNKNQELKKQLQIIGGIMKSFEAIYYVDAKTGTFLEVGASQGVRAVVGESMEAKGVFSKAVELISTEKGRKDYTEFTDMSTLLERLNGKDYIALEYETNKLKWRKGLWIPTDFEDGKPKHYIYAIQNIDEEIKRQKRLVEISETDGMTGIKNRAGGQAKIMELIQNRTAGVFGLLDCDKLKKINDVYGHAVGDKVIIAIADAMKATFREKDVIMRLGGDEFAFYVVGEREEIHRSKLPEKFLNHIKEIKISELEEKGVEVSIGAYIYTGEKESSFDSMYAKADDAMYKSKKHLESFITLVEENE